MGEYITVSIILLPEHNFEHYCEKLFLCAVFLLIGIDRFQKDK